MGLVIPFSPRHPAPLTAAMRRQIEEAAQAFLDAAEHLIAMLDHVDGDPDLEDEEPEVGAREWFGAGAHRFDLGAEA